MNSWTPTDLSIKCDDDDKENHWSFGRRQRKGLWVNTSFLLFALLKSEFIFICRKEKKTFVHVFETVDLGATTLLKKILK